MKVSSLLMAMLLWPPALFAETGFLDRSVNIGGEIFRYQVYVPLEHSPARTWPVIVNLHGGGRQGSDGLLPTVAGLAAPIRAKRSLYPAVVVFPQAKVGTYWPDREMQELVIAELESTIKEFSGDPDRVYLTGFSQGAAGVYRIAYRWPTRFAALVSIAGGVEASASGPPQNVERDQRTNPFTASPNPFEALASGIHGLPIWIAHGDADEAVPVGAVATTLGCSQKIGCECALR